MSERKHTGAPSADEAAAQIKERLDGLSEEAFTGAHRTARRRALGRREGRPSV